MTSMVAQCVCDGKCSPEECQCGNPENCSTCKGNNMSKWFDKNTGIGAFLGALVTWLAQYFGLINGLVP